MWIQQYLIWEVTGLMLERHSSQYVRVSKSPLVLPLHGKLLRCALKGSRSYHVLDSKHSGCWSKHSFLSCPGLLFALRAVTLLPVEPVFFRVQARFRLPVWR